LAELYNGGTGQVAKKKAETKIRGKAKAVPPGRNGATLGFEQTLWAAADKLRGHMDAAEYRHVILGLIFLKYISDAFQGTIRGPHEGEARRPRGSDEYTGENVFWVPREARWGHLQAHAKQAHNREAHRRRRGLENADPGYSVPPPRLGARHRKDADGEDERDTQPPRREGRRARRAARFPLPRSETPRGDHGPEQGFHDADRDGPRRLEDGADDATVWSGDGPDIAGGG
jgi:HsdM N-terminal domain